jgi:carboxymethylenebutenolidase
MKRFAAWFLLLVAPSLFAQEWARQKVDKSPRHREWVGIKAEGRTLETFVVYPESKEKRPVIVIIHEIFGLTDWVQDLSDQLAEAGYIVVAPDLLSGKGPNGGRTDTFAEGKAVEAIRGLGADEITADLNAVADYGKKLPASNGKLYVAGFCWGGGQSFRFATDRSDLSAAFVFYGGPPEKADMARINVPIYGFYAENDARIGATIADAQAAMKAAGKTYEPVTYKDAGHGFMRAGEAPDATPGNKQAREDAWKRWKELLAH